MPMPEPQLTAEELTVLVRKQFAEFGKELPVTIEHIEKGKLRLRYHVSRESLRPGGTVSGPVQMSAVDIAAYMIIQGHIGVTAMALTSDLAIRFLNKPGATDILVDASFLKLGRRLAVVECLLYSEGQDAPVSQATTTYVIPSN